jgi:hypothetical protein
VLPFSGLKSKSSKRTSEHGTLHSAVRTPNLTRFCAPVFIQSFSIKTDGALYK